MDQLFQPEEPEEARPDAPALDGPLAARMRPRTLDDFVGQEHLLAPGSALRTAIESGHPHSMVLYGPPGSGKTTLARMIAEQADAAFEELSAVNAGRPEVREVIARARERRRSGRATIFFLDEIHRFNKAQQDALLPAVEEGLVTLVGATTENPYFEVNSALLSRAQIYELHALEAADVERLLRRALDGGECGAVAVEDEAVEFLAARAGGDARAALNALELACETAARGETLRVGVADAEDAMQRKAVLYDKAGDQHYDYISAWIKSTRGSDPDASLYYLAAMLEGGEDARYIARRMIVLASEDIGNADPQALPMAVAAAQAVEHVGLPECQFALAQAAIYLSLAPKSDAAKRAIIGARAHIAEHGAQPPPGALRNAAIPAMRRMGRGVGYENPHGEPGHVNDQEHLPAGREGVRFYTPDDGEPAFRERLAELQRARARAVSALYDRIGRSYVATRGEDPRIAAAIHAALGDARTVLNVGAGAGAYEPRDRDVTAVEPSAVMRAQRPPGAAPCIDAFAEALPFPDGSFDAAMAVLSDHHWSDRLGGLRELRRVGRRAVVFQWDPAFRDAFWLVRDYLPSFGPGLEGTFEAARSALGATREEVVPIPHDCRDGFLMAYWRRPEAYLDPAVRANISVFSLLPAAEVDAMVTALRADLTGGAWERRHCDLLGRDEIDLGYRLLIAG